MLPAPVVSPNPAVHCLGDAPIRLRVLPVPFCSGSINTPVPDNNPAGASNSITVSGVPAGCPLNAVMVTINIVHTRIGDLVFALKAPNGQVINLDNRITGTNSNATTSGFTTTVISSAGNKNLSAGSSPYTDTFKADLQTGAAAGPTGFQPTTNNWAV